MRPRKVPPRPIHHHDPVVAAYVGGIRAIMRDIVREIARAAIADYTAKIVERELATPGGTKTGWRVMDGQPVHWRRAKRLARKANRAV